MALKLAAKKKTSDEVIHILQKAMKLAEEGKISSIAVSALGGKHIWREFYCDLDDDRYTFLGMLEGLKMFYYVALMRFEKGDDDG